MTAVSSRKAWAVTSHLMFFTATFWPRYSPCRTAAGWDGDQDPTEMGTDTGTYPLTRTPVCANTASVPQAWKPPCPHKLQTPD